ncbi:MAG: metallophosphoesterase family protein [Thermoanaerobaculia bacterium]
MALPTTFRIEEHGEKSRLVCFGGVYSNAPALTAMLARVAGVPKDEVYCLGDLTGGYGLHPERVLIALRNSGIEVLQGNRDYTVGHEEDDCGCGYTSARDNRFAQISFDLSRRGVGRTSRQWLKDLPHQANVTLGDKKVRLCHGSSRVMNEFLWESLPDSFYVELLAQTGVDVIVCTHTGLQWMREVAPGKYIVNCGVIGRPPNDGTTDVWYAELKAGEPPQLVKLSYHWQAVVTELQQGKLPPEFVTAIRDGWWACCYDILPPAEASRGKYSRLPAEDSGYAADAACSLEAKGKTT